jgi:hypothetical protein
MPRITRSVPKKSSFTGQAAVSGWDKVTASLRRLKIINALKSSGTATADDSAYTSDGWQSDGSVAAVTGINPDMPVEDRSLETRKKPKSKL